MTSSDAELKTKSWRDRFGAIFLSVIFPPFLQWIDRELRLNYPIIWRTRIHYFVWISFWLYILICYTEMLFHPVFFYIIYLVSGAVVTNYTSLIVFKTAICILQCYWIVIQMRMTIKNEKIIDHAVSILLYIFCFSCVVKIFNLSEINMPSILCCLYAAVVIDIICSFSNTKSGTLALFGVLTGTGMFTISIIVDVYLMKKYQYLDNEIIGYIYFLRYILNLLFTSIIYYLLFKKSYFFFCFSLAVYRLMCSSIMFFIFFRAIDRYQRPVFIFQFLFFSFFHCGS